MDINDLRSVVTVISLVLFVVLVARTWSRRRRAAFDEAAQLPFADEAQDTAPSIAQAPAHRSAP
jgi:cytochrome c oxidase cbb3-type subunit 4